MTCRRAYNRQWPYVGSYTNNWFSILVHWYLKYYYCSCWLFMFLAIATLLNLNVPELVLATVPGYPAVVRVWNRTGWSSLGCYPEDRGTNQVRGRVRTGPQFHFTVSTTLATIKYLSFDRIMTWSIRILFSFRRSFTSCIQICNPTDIRWIVVK